VGSRVKLQKKEGLTANLMHIFVHPSSQYSGQKYNKWSHVTCFHQTWRLGVSRKVFNRDGHTPPTARFSVHNHGDKHCKSLTST